MGEKAVALARILESVSEETGVSIAAAPQAIDLARIAQEIDIPVYAQHVDDCEPGARTGYVTAEAMKDAGAIGSLLNHSERQLKLSSIESTIRKMSGLALKSVVCANTPEVAVASAMLKPTAVAIEPPELIGSGTAVSKARPEIVSGTVKLIKAANPSVLVVCGAGIVNGEDVRAALKLGAQGILVASGVVKAKDPASAALDLARALI